MACVITALTLSQRHISVLGCVRTHLHTLITLNKAAFNEFQWRMPRRTQSLRFFHWPHRHAHTHRVGQRRTGRKKHKVSGKTRGEAADLRSESSDEVMMGYIQWHNTQLLLSAYWMWALTLNFSLTVCAVTTLFFFSLLPYHYRCLWHSVKPAIPAWN